jgi:hypothetical protein
MELFRANDNVGRDLLHDLKAPFGIRSYGVSRERKSHDYKEG